MSDIFLVLLTSVNGRRFACFDGNKPFELLLDRPEVSFELLLLVAPVKSVDKGSSPMNEKDGIVSKEWGLGLHEIDLL